MLGGMNSRQVPHPISAETVSQAGAGALLLAVAVVELWLAYWAAGWLHRSGGVLVAAAGATLLARALAAAAPSLRAPAPRPAEERARVSSAAATDGVAFQLASR